MLQKFRTSQLSLSGICLLLLLLMPRATQAAFKTEVQGQNFGSATWVASNVAGWSELDYIPCRIYMTGGPANNQTVTINFDHTKGTTRGIQNLTSFTGSANVVITAGPTLSAPVGADVWSYTFTVNLTDSNPGYVSFFTRLSSGAHLFGGSSLAISSGDVLQIHKPDATPGNPNLAIVKTGAATAQPGQTITYTLAYTNRANPGATLASGAQLIDTLPALVKYVSGSATGGGTNVGNSLTWDLGDLEVGTNGFVSYQVVVTNNAAFGATFQNYAQALSAETETNYSDNTSIVTTTVSFNRPPTASPDASSVNEDSILTIAASGVLANDSDPDGDTLAAILVSGVSHGILSLSTNGSYTYTPAADYFGTDTFTYRANDGATNSGLATVTITINAVNDVPFFTAGENQIVNEDAGLQTVTNWATEINRGATNESSQVLNFIVSNDNTNLFSAQPAISSSGTLTYTPKTNAYGTATVTVSLHDNGGTANGGVDTSASTNFVITINPVNDAPSFTKGPDQTINEDSGPQTTVNWALNISPGLNESAQAVNFNVSNNNTSLFAVQPAIDSTGTLTFEPMPNGFGNATITVSLQDDGDTANGGTNSSAAQTFTITVNPVNDAPSFTAGPDQTVNEGSGAQTITNWATNISAGPANESAQALDFVVNFTVVTDNDALFSKKPEIDPTGVLTYTAADDANGVATVTVSLHDDGGTANGGVDSSAPQTFHITVRPINDVPAFTKGSDQVVNEDSGLQTIINWATNITAGPVDENSQVLSFVVTNDNNGLFAVAPAIDATGILTFTPAPNANGSATATVILHDNGGTTNGGVDTSAAQTFTITVNPVNDAPSFTKSADRIVNEDAAAQTVSNWATSLSRGPANESGQALNFIVSNDNNSLFSAQPAISPTGTLTFTPTPNASGSATVMVSLHDDGGTGNGGIDTSATQTFLITINAVNDPPTFTLLTNAVTVLEDAGAQNFAVVTDISSGPANESAQTVSFIVVSNSNPGIFSVAPNINTNGILNFTSATDANGVATLTFALKDNGGTNGGGSDTSVLPKITITVVPVNDAPSFSLSSNSVTVLEDSRTNNIIGFATNIKPGPTNENGQTLTFLVLSNSNPSLFSIAPSLATNGTLNFATATNANGSANISVLLQDNGGTNNGGSDTSAVTNFTITLLSVNDRPTLGSLITSVTALEDSGAQTFSVASNITAGAANESSQAVSFLILSNSNPGIFSTAPSITTNGILSFTPAANSNGVAVITFVLKDDGGTNNGGLDTSVAYSPITITITPVNDAPSFLKGPDVTVSEDAGSYLFSAWATSISSGPPNESTQALNFIVTNTNTALFSSGPSVNSSGQLSFTPAANANGTTTVSIALHDNGGTTNGGLDTSPTQNFTITINPVNDPPTFTLVTNAVAALEDAGAKSFAVATNISIGPTNESGQTISFIVVSNSNPTLFSIAPAIGTNGILTFTSAPDSNGIATVTFVAKDDGGTNGNDTSVSQTVTITITPVNDTPSFTLSTNQVTVLEDSGAATLSNFTLNISSGPPNENSQTNNFIILSNSNPGLFAAGPTLTTNGNLSFTPVTNANGNATIVFVLHDSGGTGNGGIDTSATQTFTIIVTPVNDPPAFNKGPDVTVNEDSGAQLLLNWALNIRPGPTNEAGQLLDFIVSSDNLLLFSVQPAISPNGTLTFTPAPNANGTSTIRIVLHDSGGIANGGIDSSLPQFFVIHVNSINDAPSFAKGSDQTVDEDAGPQIVSGWATDISAGPPNEGSQTVDFLVTSSNPGLFFAQPAVTSDGTLIYIPAANANGTATVSVVARDNGGTAFGGMNASAPQTFLITVNPINDPPSFTKGDDQSVNEDAPSQVISNWATAIVAGPANESSQSLNFIVSNNASNLFSIQPSIDPSGTLTYQLAADRNGSATVSVTLFDDGGTDNGGNDSSSTQTFEINANSVNDAPTFAAGTNITLLEDSGLKSIAWATSISPGPTDESDQTLDFVVSNDNNGLFSVQPAMDSTGTLTFVPTANSNGVATVTVYLHDDAGTANGGVDVSTTTNFIITILPVNDAPTFTPGTNEIVLEDSGLHVHPWATGINAGGGSDESGQSLSFVILSNDNPGLFSVQPTINANNGFLTYTSAANANGVAVLKVVLHDNGGTDNSGVADSASQTLTITVTPVNDAPSFTPGPNILVNSDAGLQTIPNWATTILAGPPDESGQSLTFILTISNTNLFNGALGQPAISSTGALTFQPATNVYGVTTNTVMLQDNGGTANGGANTSAIYTFYITNNSPPLVSIEKPVNLAQYADSKDIEVKIKAFDLDGTVTNVQFFVGNSNLWQTNFACASIGCTNTYSFIWPKVPQGNYLLTARAMDNRGATNNAVISINVITNVLGIFSAGPVTFNTQNGLWQQTDFITNKSASVITVAVLLFSNLQPTNAIIYNATGKTNRYNEPGDANAHFYILYNQPIQPHSITNILVQYYTTGHVAPTSTVTAIFLETAPQPVETPTNLTQIHIIREKFLSDRTFLLDFATVANRTYYIFYSSTLSASIAPVENPFDSTNWTATPQTILGNGSPYQWIDYGPPLTPTMPTNAPYRYYRVYEKP